MHYAASILVLNLVEGKVHQYWQDLIISRKVYFILHYLCKVLAGLRMKLTQVIGNESIRCLALSLHDSD